jgi:hypothetical protein
VRPFIAALSVCLLLSSPAAFAQTRSRKATPQRRRAPAASSPSRIGSTQANAARIRLGDQIKNLTKFLYLYGRFSKDLELTSARAEGSEAANRTRATLIDSLRNVREGLDELERQFRLTPGLETQYRRLAGVAQTAAEAEERATSNQLDQAGRMLIDVVNRLTDVLLEM